MTRAMRKLSTVLAAVAVLRTLLANCVLAAPTDAKQVTAVGWLIAAAQNTEINRAVK
jgi:hypothetical protein